jgi:hypothetical protein
VVGFDEEGDLSDSEWPPERRREEDEAVVAVVEFALRGGGIPRAEARLVAREEVDFWRRAG